MNKIFVLFLFVDWNVVINAQAQAAKLLQLAQAHANATALLLSFESVGLSTVKNELNLTTDLVIF
jgi:hypothetical protein